MEEQKLIDAAISSIEDQIRDHREASTKILICGFVFATLIFVAGHSVPGNNRRVLPSAAIQ